MDAVQAFQAAFAEHQRGNLPEAERVYREIIAKAPQIAQVHHLLGVLLHQRGETAEGLRSVRQAIDLDCSDWRYWSDLGCLLTAQHDLEEAGRAHREAVSLAPEQALAHANLAGVLRHLGKLDEALAACDRAVQLAPQSADCLVCRGDTARELGLLDQAERDYAAALKLEPEHLKARANRAFLRLQQGDFAAGWDDYELRWQTEDGLASREFFDIPHWQGEPLTGKSLLVHAEQGLGDEIMFAQCWPELAAGAERVVATCAPRLQRLFARSFPEIELHPVERGSERQWFEQVRPRCDLHIPAGSVPRFLRPSVESFSHSGEGYLRADRLAIADWRARLAGCPAPRIGIAWQAGGRWEHRRHRSTKLADWLPLLETDSVCWVNLQYGDTAEQRERLHRESGIELLHFPEADPLGELDTHAALISALDLVIAVDSTTVHLAGGLGKPVWTLASRCSGWRWTAGRDDSLWYPRMTILRQPNSGEWAPLFHRAAAELARSISRMAHPAPPASAASGPILEFPFPVPQA